jgi:hypothetical protein
MGCGESGRHRCCPLDGLRIDRFPWDGAIERRLVGLSKRGASGAHYSRGACLRIAIPSGTGKPSGALHTRGDDHPLFCSCINAHDNTTRGTYDADSVAPVSTVSRRPGMEPDSDHEASRGSDV